jgi:hypothetical protein
MKLGQKVERFSIITLEDGKEKEIKRVLRRPRHTKNGDTLILFDKRSHTVNYDNKHELPYIIIDSSKVILW